MARASQAVERQQAANTEMVISPETRELFASMVVAVPEAEDGSGTERILLAVLQANNWDALDDPWDTEKTAALVGVELAIHTISRHASSYEDGLGVFLVAHAKRLDDGREVVFSTGSISVVAQLVRAYMLGAFPLYAILRQSDKPTKRGYYPQHLEIMASSGNAAVAS